MVLPDDLVLHDDDVHTCNLFFAQIKDLSAIDFVADHVDLDW